MSRTCHTLFAMMLLTTAAADARQYGGWGDPQPVSSINSVAASEGCPIESPDGLALYFASNRAMPGAQGKLDIYYAQRASPSSPWGEPVNPGGPVNSAEFDYCPTPLHGKWLLLVSSRQTDDDCFPGDTPPPAPIGGPAAGDILLTRNNPAHGWEPLLNLGCYPQGPNTAGAEFSPSMVETSSGAFLFFSSNGYPDSQGQDIYVSKVLDDGTVLPGQRVAELSSPADDRMPNVSKDGLEIVFSSNRVGATAFNQDIYVARRGNPSAPWSAPERIDNPLINTAAAETRASLSGDGTRLYFGRKTTLADPGDMYVSMRVHLTGNGRR